MPKFARVAILMAAMIIFAIAMLNLVRSKVEASGRAFKTAAVQYTTLRKIYTAPGTIIGDAAGASDKTPDRTVK
jgi:hypothetical protein